MSRPTDRIGQLMSAGIFAALTVWGVVLVGWLAWLFFGLVAKGAPLMDSLGGLLLFGGLYAIVGSALATAIGGVSTLLCLPFSLWFASFADRRGVTSVWAYIGGGFVAALATSTALCAVLVLAAAAGVTGVTWQQPDVTAVTTGLMIMPIGGLIAGFWYHRLLLKL
jgi:hypothetical protein